MTGFQFIHYETYAAIPSRNSKKQGVNGVSAEAERIPYACKHINKPKRPNVVFGFSANKACDLALKQAEEKKDSIGRKLRLDAQILLSGICSYPIEPNSIQFNNIEYLSWRKKSVDFLHSEWGEQFVSAIEHTDEKFLHIHFYVLPKPDNDKLHIRSICKAIAARDAIADHGLGSGKARAKAYKDQMRDFQNRYFNAVSIYFGHSRIGPKRKRLTRKEWKLEQAENDKKVIRDREMAKLIIDNENTIKLISDKNNFFLEKEKSLKQLLISIRDEQIMTKSLINKSIELTSGGIFSRIRNANAYLLDELRELTDELNNKNKDLNSAFLESKQYKSKYFSCQHELSQAHVKINQLNSAIQIRNIALDKLKQQMNFMKCCLKSGEYHKIENRGFENDKTNR